MTTWKAVELRIAKMIGGERVPITGRIRGSAPDIEHDKLSVEVKHRKQLPGWLKDAMDQAVKSIKGDRTPVVILHECGKNHKNDFMVFRLGDFTSMTADEFLAKLREAGM